jgi:hypothetical protein
VRTSSSRLKVQPEGGPLDLRNGHSLGRTVGQHLGGRASSMLSSLFALDLSATAAFIGGTSVGQPVRSGRAAVVQAVATEPELVVDSTTPYCR